MFCLVLHPKSSLDQGCQPSRKIGGVNPPQLLTPNQCRTGLTFDSQTQLFFSVFLFSEKEHALFFRQVLMEKINSQRALPGGLASESEPAGRERC